jgi:hypothetical protein
MLGELCGYQCSTLAGGSVLWMEGYNSESLRFFYFLCQQKDKVRERVSFADGRDFLLLRCYEHGFYNRDMVIGVEIETGIELELNCLKTDAPVTCINI